MAEQQFKTEIWRFIKRLRQVSGLKVVTNGMSTQVFGEYELATTSVIAEMQRVHQQVDTAVFVCKFVAGDLSQVEAES
jgi:hypothetical protein